MDHLHSRKIQSVSYEKISELLKNTGRVTVSYDAFNQAYQSSDFIQSIVQNYDGEKIEFKGAEKEVEPDAVRDKENSVPAMAKRATDLGD